MRRTVAALLLALALCVLGLGAVSTTRVNVVWFRHRPWVLKFGPAEKLGHCLVRETADPASDVLSNLVDLDADGKPELRSAGFIDGSTPRCERRVLLGFWADAPLPECRAAAESCSRE
ncbi:MAG: hypothetical protein IPJ65_02705 [Archangiaceae bacterium]|nr:hypothetical protein [Archangiaceae bacterium]